MVRIRNLVLAIAAATALTSEMASALGLGEVALRSSLNQPLDAEIELLDVRTLTSEEVIPGLAPVEAFNRVGIERPYFLTDLMFTPILRPDGKNVIRVTSNKPVREPYLNFLVEVTWPSGRLLREYTLLLDPPLYSPEAVAAAAPHLPIAAQASRQAVPSPPSAQLPAAQQGVDGDQYRTSPRDTLWQVATRARQGGTVHQTMLAIQALNPNAFIDGNINLMKSGQVLRLPNAEQIASRSQTEALAEVAQQNSAWRQGRGAPATRARQLDATQRSSAGAAPSRSETGDSLRLVAPERGKSAAGSDSGAGDNGAALRDKLAVAQEDLDSTRRENIELEDRLDDLEAQLDKLQRLMQLKDDQLAKLQAQLASQGSVATVDPVSGSEAGRAEPATPASPPAVAADPAGEAQQPSNHAGADSSVPEQAAAASEPVVDESKSSGTATSVLADPVMLGAVGGAVLLLLLVGLIALSRRNAMREAELQERLLAANEPGNPFAAELGYQVAELDKRILSDFEAQRSAERSAAPSADALAEAEAYIAYGRFNQAAERLQNALNDEPQRSDLRLKLMEAYAELGDRAGFAREEAELREIGGASSGIDQLRAKYPMVATAASQNAGDEFGLSLDGLEKEPVREAPVANPSTMSGADLPPDDELSFNERAPDYPAYDALDDDGSLRLDLDDEVRPGSARAALDQDLSDFSLDLDTVDKEASGNELGFELTQATESETGLEEPVADGSLDQGLSPLKPRPQNSAPQLNEGKASLDELLRDNDEPTTVETSALMLDDTDELNEDFDFLSDTDETTTKLDLARAYIDMGDSEGARDILDEVISEGNDSQQSEAREMLAKLA